MKSHYNLAHEEQHFLQRQKMIQVKKKITNLATFLPDIILKARSKNFDFNRTHKFIGVLIGIQFSNLLKLMEYHNKIGPSETYKMVTNINSYIAKIIDVFKMHDADILTIFGDNFLALLRIHPNEVITEVVHNSLVCVSTIIKLLRSYKTDTSLVMELKCCVSFGNISFKIIGNDNIKKVALVGEAIKDLNAIIDVAKWGKITLCKNLLMHLVSHRYQIYKSEELMILSNISYKSSELDVKLYFDDKYLKVQALIQHHEELKRLNLAKLKANISKTNLEDDFLRKIPIRIEVTQAYKYWNIFDLESLINCVVYYEICENQPVEHLTEMREVTVMYIHVIPEENLVADKLIELMNFSLVTTIEKIKNKMAGIVSSINFKSDGFLIKVTFGLRTQAHQNESRNALITANQIVTNIKNHSAIEIRSISIGISNGIALCGVFGHFLRHEYEVIGRCNESAKKLALSWKNKITCDSYIFKSSKLPSFHFTLLESDESGINKVWQYDEYSHIKEEEEDIEIIDRIEEINEGLKIINSKMHDNNSLKGICFHGMSLIGKSHILNCIQRKVDKLKSCVVVKVSLDVTSKAPYFCVSQIYQQLYDQIFSINEEDIKELPIPRYLLSSEKCKTIGFLSNDLSIKKYEILNVFRNLIECSLKKIAIFLDDVQYIDLQSREILEIVFTDGNIRYIFTGTFKEEESNVRFNLKLWPNMIFKELNPMKLHYTAQMISNFANADVIPLTLIHFFEKLCKGIPGLMEWSLLRFINNKSLILTLTIWENLDKTQKYYVRDNKIDKNSKKLFSLLTSNAKIPLSATVTMDSIILELYDSLSPFDQLVIKTAALLGKTFLRYLLVVALKYPNKERLAQSLKTLFQEQIFECGSRYLYQTKEKYTLLAPNTKIKICCQCHFKDDFFAKQNCNLPKYAYCKVIHFKSSSMQKIAYNLITNNHKLELHKLCCEVIESMEHLCPVCLKEPIGSFIFSSKYQDMLKLFDKKTKYEKSLPNTRFDKKIIDCIRNNTIKKIESDQWVNVEKEPLKCSPNLANCKCLQILFIVYRDLIHHSRYANEVGRQIFFNIKFALICMFLNGLPMALKYLIKARELCLKDEKEISNITDDFRKFHVGKSSMLIAWCHLKIGNNSAAKTNIAISLRQFHVPSLVLSYKYFQPLLTRSFLVNTRIVRPLKTKKDLNRWEFGLVVFTCAKYYFVESNWNMSKKCLLYSFYLLKSANANVSILMDIYCSASDLFRMAGDLSTCIKLQKCMLKDYQINFAFKERHNLKSLVALMNILVDIECILGNIEKSLRIAFRMVDLIQTTEELSQDPDTLQTVCELSIYRLNFCDFKDTLKLLQSTDSPLCYYATCMLCYHLTGFYVIPLEEILRFAEKNVNRQSRNNRNPTEVILVLMIQLELIRRDRFESAKQWHVMYDFSETHAACNSHMIRIQLLSTEIAISGMRRSNEPQLRRVARQSLESLRKAVKKNCLYGAHFKCLQSWFFKLSSQNYRSKRALREAYRLCKENLLMKCFIAQLSNYWRGGFAYAYTARPKVSIQKAPNYTMDQLAQFLHPYPLF